MKPLILFLTLFTLPFYANAQDNPYDTKILEGIELHDKGNYEGAIAKYKEAIKLNKKAALAYYELGLSYYALKDYKKAKKYASKSIKYAKDERIKVSSYLIKGTALDDSGSTKKAIKVYKRGIKDFPDNYLLHYNVGFSYYKIDDFKNAEKALQKALQLNPEHNTSHLLMAYVMGDRGLRVQSLMSLMQFLFLENRTHPVNITNRSIEGYNSFLKQSLGTVTRKDEKSININLFLDKDDEFSALNLLLSLMQANNQVKADSANLTQTQRVDLFMSDFSEGIAEQAIDKNSFWSSYYVQFFQELNKQELIIPFTKMMQLSTKEDEVISWLSKNKAAIEKLENAFNAFYKIE